MASIVKRGKSYSVVYYQGTGKNVNRFGNPDSATLLQKAGKPR